MIKLISFLSLLKPAVKPLIHLEIYFVIICAVVGLYAVGILNTAKGPANDL